MAKCIMIQGTCSNAGKSVIAGGLCRIFRQDGYRVAPFKSQNMALNSYITRDGFEMGRAQVMQAECAGIAPDVRMNPILLKPTSDEGSQVIVNGVSIGNMRAQEYYKFKNTRADEVKKAYDSLAAEYDIIVIEGAGSPAEINLRENDIVNMGLAEMVDAPVLIVGDIDRGGVFASLYGTVALLSESEQERVRGTIINKFRGDVELLKPGLDMLENLIHKPVIGVVPYTMLDIDDEDSLSERLDSGREVRDIDIAVIRLPKISNFTDFNVLENRENVSLRYVSSLKDLKNPDLIILPGTKSTMADLRWLRESGLEAEILKHVARNKPVFGICGGYQMLGESISDPDGTEGGGEIRGMGLLKHSTLFSGDKVREQVTGTFGQVYGVLAGLGGAELAGYEIHMGRAENAAEAPLVISGAEGEAKKPAGGQKGNIYGCYIHGIFDRTGDRLIKCLCDMKGIEYTPEASVNVFEQKEREYDRLADHLRRSLDIARIYEIMGVQR